MIATILDTVTRQTKSIAGIPSYQWAENNYSCDCNRDFFTNEENETNVCLGHKRFLIVGAVFNDPDETQYTLEEFNSGYPKELVEKFVNATRGP